MDVEFFASDPRRKARQALDDVMRRGVDQLAIACAFCTAAGVSLLERHTSPLAQPDSFVVVAAAPPTDYVALGDLHMQIPGRVFVQWGAIMPVEAKNGPALMHSKVFYARSGRECWLWTGSHNLTANAAQGGNCEAAILLHGDVDEKPFVDALQHLLACRDSAAVYDPEVEFPQLAERTDVLVVHAEADRIPDLPLPWRMHLCLNSAEYDDLLAEPVDVHLLLYPSGSLVYGWQRATPVAAFSGLLTGKNLTDKNPYAKRAGTPAAWAAANFSIVDTGSVLVLRPDSAPGPQVTTQAVMNFDSHANPEDSLFSDEPKVVTRPVPGEVWSTTVDEDMRRFFRRQHVQGSQLLHQLVIDRQQVVRVPEDEFRQGDFAKIRAELADYRNLPLEYAERTDQERMGRHPFIVRARYRVGGIGGVGY